MENPQPLDEKHQLAIKISQIGIIEIDYANNTSVADQKAAELFDLPPHVPITRETVHRRFHDDDREEIERNVSKSLDAKGSGEFQMEHRVVHSDGSIRWLNVRKQIRFDQTGNGKATTGVLAAVDVTDRREAENRLRRSHRTFENLVENNPHGLYVIDADMRLRYASKGARHTFQSIEPLVGSRLEDIMHTLWPSAVASDTVNRFRHTLETGESYSAPPLVAQRVDIDAIKASDWSIERTVLPDGRYGVVCYFFDNTLRQQAAETLAQSEHYFREMADAAPAMVWVTDENHYCNFLSKSWFDFTGQPVHQGHGIGWMQMIHPEDYEDAKSILLGNLERREEFEYDYRLRTADGGYRWVIDAGRPRFDASGTFRGFVGSVIDAHERHMAREGLKQSENRLRLAAETTGFGTYDYIIGTDSVLWSNEMYRIFQIEIGEPIDSARRLERIHPKDRGRFETLFHKAIKPGADQVFNLEFRIVRPSGEIRWVIDSGRVLFSEDERNVPERVIGTLQDVTERKIFEQSLKRAKRVAEAANRSRGEFLANMSHEIRTPMAAILGHADILKDHLQDPDNVQVVETIRRNGNFLLGIINDILDLSKIDAGKLEIERERVRPDELIAEVRSLMDVRAAEKKIPLKIVFDGLLPETTEIDAIRMRQILINLIGNAIKFTDEGEVRLVTSYDAERQQLRFDIMDTGIGIKERDLETLFKPFEQADSTSKRTFGGTGLGLAICRRLALALGGDVEVESEFGKGSKFTLYVAAPATGDMVEPNLNLADATVTATQDIRLECTVLVVDDRRDIRYLAQHFIEKAGGCVVTATDGQEAVDYVKSDKTPSVDLIVMDMQMPVMDGYEATAELRQHGCELPIIALTANAMKSDRDQCLAAGCTDYTTKPLDSQRLISMIADLTQTTP
jgi:PAS domain S-box-containing protein